MNRIKGYLLIMCLLVGTIANAGEHCWYQGDRNELCTGSDYAEADNILNDVYQEILYVYEDNPEFIKRLKVAQRAWLKLRDAEFLLRYPDTGYTYPVSEDEDEYMTAIVNARVHFLLQWLEDEDGTQEEQLQGKNTIANEADKSNTELDSGAPTGMRVRHLDKVLDSLVQDFNSPKIEFDDFSLDFLSPECEIDNNYKLNAKGITIFISYYYWFRNLYEPVDSFDYKFVYPIYDDRSVSIKKVLQGYSAKDLIDRYGHLLSQIRSQDLEALMHALEGFRNSSEVFKQAVELDDGRFDWDNYDSEEIISYIESEFPNSKDSCMKSDAYYEGIQVNGYNRTTYLSYFSLEDYYYGFWLRRYREGTFDKTLELINYTIEKLEN